MIQEQLEKLYQLQKDTANQIQELKTKAAKSKAVEDLMIAYSYLGELEKEARKKKGVEQRLLLKYVTATLREIRILKEETKHLVKVVEKLEEGKTVVTIDAL